MKLKSIRIERFRQFEDITVELQDVNLLVGPNNSGKTSVLYALRAFFSLMHGHVRFEGTPPKATYHKRYLAGPGEVAPAPDLKELWHKQQAGKPMRITATFVDGKSFSVVLKQQFGQIHVSADNLPVDLTAKEANNYLGQSVAFIPGLVGVLVEEPFATSARRNALATQGRYSEIFRSSLHQLKSKDASAVERINKWLADLFGVHVEKIDFDIDNDEYVTIRYKQGDEAYDVVSSGSGLQQIIQVLTYLYLAKPKLLLIDEPDAHLHSRLQARLGEVLRNVANDLDAQLFISTHSVDLVDSFSTQQVIVVDRSKKRVSALGSNEGLVESLVDAGVVDVSSLSRILASRRLVVVEDKDQTILKSLDKAVGSPLYSKSGNSYVLPSKGVSNFRALSDIGKVLTQLIGRDFDIAFIQDRDGMPDSVSKDYLAGTSFTSVTPYMLERHEIENYLLDETLIVHAAKKVHRSISAKNVRDAILLAANTLKSEARRSSREAARVVNRHLDADVRRDDKALELEVDAWFDGLDLKAIETIVRVFPGKELLPQVLKILNAKDSAKKDLTKGVLVASLAPEHVPAELKELLLRFSK